MKKLFTLILLGFGITLAHAQKNIGLKLAAKVSVLKITTGDASVDFEGYDGNTLIVEAIKTDQITLPKTDMHRVDLPHQLVKDSVGYKMIKNDSTIFDIWITTTYKHLRIRVPNHYAQLLDINALSYLSQSEVTVKNIAGPFNMTTQGTIVRVSHVTGPFKIVGGADKLILKDIDWQQPSATETKYAIVFDKDIDITLPANLKASITGGPMDGKLYSDLPLVAHQTSTKGTALESKMPFVKDMALNGGGISVSVISSHGNIYLRKAN